MPSKDDIRRQIAAYPNPYIFWTQKEIRNLPKILDDNETIKALTSGMINGKTWLAVCTNRRMIFLNCSMFIGVEQVQMPLDRIQSIDHQFRLFFGSVSIFDGINVFALTMIRKSAVLPFVKATESAMFSYRQGQRGMQSATAQPADVASQLAKLADLKEKGYLSEEEFQTQKKKLLG